MNTNKLDNYLLSNFCKLINLQLDDTNYVTWRFMLESMLVGCDLMGYIDGSIQCPLQYKTTKEGDITSELTQEFKDWRKNDSALITLLASTLSSNALSFIVGSKSSKEVWFSLEERYGKLSKYKAYELKISMQQIQKGNDSIDKYMDRFKTIRDRLSVAGVFVSDEDIIDSVLHGLPFEYATMKTIIRIKTLTSSVSMAELRSLLLIAEYEIEQNVKSILERSKIEMVAHADRFRSGNCISQGTQIGGSSLPKDMYDASGSLYSSSTTHIGHAPPSSAMTGNPHIPPASSISQIGYVSASTRMTARTGSLSPTTGYLLNYVPQMQSYGHELHSSTTPTSSCVGHNNTFSYSNNRKYDKHDMNNMHFSGNSIPHFSNENQGFCGSIVRRFCGKRGHYAYNCYQRKSQFQNIGSSSFMKCQICKKRGHSAKSCYYIQPQVETNSFSFQPGLCAFLPYISCSRYMPLIPPG